MRVKVFSIILILVLLHFNLHANTFFVSTDGDDSNDGAINTPWKTIKHGLNQLSAGDTLNIRHGVYYENTFTVQLQGTSSDPIIVQAYQGENVNIDGGISSFLNAPNSKWMMVDNAINLYKSTSAITGNFVNAWFAEDSIQVIEYEDTVNLKSQNYGPVNGFNPIYQGPGIYKKDDGYLYIRLEQNPNDLYDVDSNTIVGKPIDINPNNNNIHIFSSKVLFYLDNAKHIIFKRLNFSYSKYLFDVRNNCSNISFESCKFAYGNTGIIIRDASYFDIVNCEFDNGLPQNIYWTDVKNRAYEVAEPYPEFQSKSISGALIHFNIKNSYFHNGFDALGIKDGSRNTSVANCYFIGFRDDAIDLRADIDSIEIKNNMLWNIGSGISMTWTNTQNSGDVFIHHNVIDNSIRQHGGREGNYREDNWPIWTVIDPFGSHGDKIETGWKIYNNTIVTKQSGYKWTAAGPNAILGNPEKYVLNNIFLVLDDRIVFRGDTAVNGALYDGNIMYRYAPTTYPLLYDFGDENNYNSLVDFQTNSGTNWEISGLEINPLLDTLSINSRGFDSLYIWERYRPRNSEVYSTGATYDNYNWPGTENNYFRGALKPGTAIWKGVDTVWSNSDNWTKGIVPDEAYKVIIPSNPEFGSFPTINSQDTAKCYNISFENNSFLTINGSLKVMK